MTLVTAAFMDRAGRKPLLTASHAGMAACLAVMSAFMFLPSEFPAKPAAPRCAALPPPPPLPTGSCTLAPPESLFLQRAPPRATLRPSHSLAPSLHLCPWCSARVPGGGGVFWVHPGLCAVLCAGLRPHPLGLPSGDSAGRDQGQCTGAGAGGRGPGWAAADECVADNQPEGTGHL